MIVATRKIDSKASYPHLDVLYFDPDSVRSSSVLSALSSSQYDLRVKSVVGIDRVVVDLKERHWDLLLLGSQLDDATLLRYAAELGSLTLPVVIIASPESSDAEPPEEFANCSFHHLGDSYGNLPIILEHAVWKSGSSVGRDFYADSIIGSQEWEYIRFSDGKFLEVAHACEVVCGYSPDDFMRDSQLMEKIIHADDHQRYDSHRCETPAARGLDRIVIRIHHKDGSVRWIEHSCRPIYDRNGQLIATKGLNRDITEREKVSAALAVTQNRLEDTLRLAGIGWWEYDCLADVLDWSDEVYRIFQLERGEFGGTYAAFLELVHPADLEHLKKEFEHAIANKRPYAVTHRICLPGGREKILREYARSVYDKNGNPVRSFGLVQDITAVDEQQKKLNQTLALLNSFLDITTDIVFFKDADLNYTLVNQAFCQLVGLDEVEVLGASDLDLFPADVAHSFRRDDVETMQTRQMKNYHEAVPRRAAMRDFLTAKGPLVLDGEVCGVFGVARDVTEQKQIDLLLKRQSVALDQSPSGVVLASARGVIEYVNESYLRSTGQSLKELLGSPLQFFESGPDYSSLTYTAIRECLRRRESWKGELMCHRRSGDVWWQEAVVTPVLDQWGEISSYLMLSEDITEERALAKKVDFLENYDHGSGLMTPSAFIVATQAQIRKLAASERSCGVVYVRIDNSNMLCDAYGYSILSVVMSVIRSRIEHLLGDDLFAARIGQDVFVMFFYGSLQGSLAGGLLRAFARVFEAPFRIGGHSVDVRGSTGVAICPEHGTDPELLIQCASSASAEVSRVPEVSGVVFSGDLGRSVEERAVLWRSLRAGIDRDELKLMYQPRVNIITGEIMGMECLVRWQHPALGLLSPDRFIPLAEETGLISQLGKFVLRAACRQAHLWVSQGILSVPLAVNLSAAEFSSPDIANQVSTILREENLAPEYLEIEVTESTAMGSIPETVAKLKVLREIGFALALDDFGTGHASLAHLDELAFDYLKVDQSFIAKITESSSIQDKAIVRSVIELANAFNFKVIAEGVETFFQRDFLLHNDCTIAQGYLFSRPLSAADMTDLLASRSALVAKRVE